MVSPDNFTIPKEQQINKLKNSNMILTQELERLKKENKWYNKTYGPYIEKRGLNNWKNLFRRPNLLEWTIFIMLLLSLFMGWAYKHDTELCRSYIQEQEQRIINPILTYPTPNFNLSKLELNEETIKESGG